MILKRLIIISSLLAIGYATIPTITASGNTRKVGFVKSADCGTTSVTFTAAGDKEITIDSHVYHFLDGGEAKSPQYYWKTTGGADKNDAQMQMLILASTRVTIDRQSVLMTEELPSIIGAAGDTRTVRFETAARGSAPALMDIEFRCPRGDDDPTILVGDTDIAGETGTYKMIESDGECQWVNAEHKLSDSQMQVILRKNAVTVHVGAHRIWRCGDGSSARAHVSQLQDNYYVDERDSDYFVNERGAMLAKEERKVMNGLLQAIYLRGFRNGLQDKVKRKRKAHYRYH